MADTTTELEVLDQIAEVLGGQSGQYETVVPVLQQIKELLASGITDPESIAEAVTAWLDEHPEATTTVQDGSITVMKLAQDVIGLLDDKADIDGYYSQLTAGLAENLIGRGDAVPAEYLYRTAGGTADIEDGIATIDCIKGNTLVWNQFCGNNASTSTLDGVTATYNGDGSWTMNGTESANGYRYFASSLRLYAGHSYLVKGCPSGGSSDTYYISISGAGVDYGNGGINTNLGADTTVGTLQFHVKAGVTLNNVTVWPQLFDLTLMFGAGNEPATVEEFEALFPMPYYPYSAPKLLPVDIRGVETVGFNAYNPSTGEAELLGGHQYQISGTYTQLSYSTGESIALDSDGIFTPSENGTLTVTGGNATDTCVHLVWSGYRNGEYEEYWSAERPIDTSRFFPTGLKKVGDKADALYADHYDTVIGAVDLGTLTWTAYSGGFYSYAIADALAGSATNRYDHITCAPYTSQNVASLSELSDKCCSIDSGRYIQVKDSSYATAADFTAAMSGVILYYELATPTTTEIDPPLNLSYKVSDFGTERIMVDETADAPQSAPVPMEVEYGINAIDTIRRLPTEYQSHKSMGQLTAALESSLGIDITETWDEDDQRYEYEIDSLEIGADKIADGAVTDAKLAQTGGVLSRVDDMESRVATLYDLDERSATTGTDNYALNAVGKAVSTSGSRIDKYPVTQGDVLFLSVSKDNDGVFQFMKSSANPLYNIDNMVGQNVTERFTGFVQVPDTATYLFVSRLLTNTTNKVFKITGSKVNEIAEKVDRTQYGIDKGNTDALFADIFTIGSEITKNEITGYICKTDGFVTSADGYKVAKYPVTASGLVYVKASAIEGGCSVSFRSSDGTTTSNVVLLLPDGLDGVFSVPEGASYLFVCSTTADTTAVAKSVTYEVSAEVQDGSVGFTKLDSFLQGKIGQIGAITTETGVGYFHAEEDEPSYGSELLDGTGWTQTGWTGDFSNGFTHVSGTDPLERDISGLEAGSMYRFTITTSNARVNGYSDFYVSLGGSATFETYRGGGSSVSYEYALVAGAVGTKLTITPSSAYTGTVTGLSLKKITDVAQLPAITVSDTDDAVTTQLVTGKAQNTSIFIGVRSGEKSVYGRANTALGVNSMKSNTDGFWNVAVGMNALADNIHGTRNVAIGYIALQHCVTGDRNVAIGSFALNGLTSGRGNIAIGPDAMQTANGNYGIGIGVGANGGGGESNIAIGRRAGNTSGQKNAIVGDSAMETSSGADFNVAIGYQANQKATGDYNVSIGAMAGKSSTSGNNNIVIGYNVQKVAATDSDSIVIGGASHSKVVIAGKVLTFNQDGTVTWTDATA